MRRKHPGQLVAGVLGFALCAATCLAYARTGYHAAFPVLLLVGVLITAWSLQRPDAPADERRGDVRSDIVAVAILIAISAPLYWWRLYTTPWQVNTDEVTIMVAAKQVLAAPTDVLGLSGYYGLPAGIFVVIGRLGRLLGGIDLYHMRIVHSCFGVGCVLLAYGLFRQFCRPLRAATLALFLGANHALFAISRMAMRENTALFLELLALLLLVRGFQRRSRSLTFLGGAATGLTFYTYFPARITLVVWSIVLAAMWLRRPSRVALIRLASFATFFLAGWAVVAAPIVIASAQHHDAASAYPRQQFLFYPEGRALQQQWTNDRTPADAWKKNIKQGLATFNGKMHDQGYIYANYGHGFVDPVTGVLLWIGLMVATVRLVKSQEPSLPDILAITGFLVLYLSFALVITKAPNYTRLLVVLPFVAYLAGTGLWWLAKAGTSRLLVGRAPDLQARAAASVVIVVTAVVTLLNVATFRDFVWKGVKEGNDVGSTGRLVEARKQQHGHSWILSADSTAPYYSWGEKGQWQAWLGFFAGPGQPVRVITTTELASLSVPGDFTVFMQRQVWDANEERFRAAHHVDSVTNVLPGGRLVAVDVGPAN
jgi:4-amino-4-deoxy-L-arabinose transferase-like glycosyltransferase